MFEEYFLGIAENLRPTEELGDYKGSDGLLYCGNCKAPKESYVKYGDKNVICGIPCDCQKEKQNAEKAQREKEKIEERRRKAFSSQNSRRLDYTFARDDHATPEVTKQLKAYCENFSTYRNSGIGLLLYSRTNGGGKTFFACAVANELIEQGYFVRVTDFMTLRDEMFERREGKPAYIQELRKYDLLVIDDFGSESGTEHMREVEYRIINDLTENQVPIILTTNYTLDDMDNTSDTGKKRIFDRVFGNCVAISIDPPAGKSRRLVNSKRIFADFKELVSTSEARMNFEKRRIK